MNTRCLLMALVLAGLSAHSALSSESAVWCINDMAKIDPTSGKAHEDNPQLAAKSLSGDYRSSNGIWDGRQVKLTGAKNEVLAFQIIINGPAKGVAFSVSDLTGPSGSIPGKNVSLFREWYLKIANSAASDSLGEGWYPDALIPVELGTDKYGAPLDIPDPRNHVDGQRNQAVWVDVYIPETTAPGHYKGAITLSNVGVTSIPIDVEVMNFTIPNAFHYIMGLNSYGETEGMPQAMRIKYFQLAQRHRIFMSIDSHRIKPNLDAATGHIDWSSYDTANAPLLDGSAFSAAAAYGPGPMQNTPIPFWELPFAANIPRVRNVYRGEAWPMDFKKARTPEYETLFKNTLQAFDEHFKSKGWTKTLYILFFNGADEPTAYTEYQDIKYLGKLVSDVKSPLFTFKADFGHFADCPKRVPEFKTLADMMTFLDPVVTCWAANGGCQGSSPLFDIDALAAQVAKGKLAFFYGTNPPPDQGGVSVDSDSLGPRLWLWIAARYNLSGGELWEIMYNYKDAWLGKPTSVSKENGKGTYGYAQYIYPESGLGVDFGGPIGSIRLKQFRRGQQDGEYFYLAKQAGFKAKVDQLLAPMISEALNKAAAAKRPSLGNWNHDPDAYEHVRLELGHMLSK